MSTGDAGFSRLSQVFAGIGLKSEAVEPETMVDQVLPIQDKTLSNNSLGNNNKF
jgi:hypothetical protein